MSTTHPVITAWSAYSAFGMGRAAFADGVAARRAALSKVDHGRWGTTDDVAGLVPGFEPRSILGKGTRGMNRASGLAVATVRSLQEEIQADETTGVVLGTTTGSAQTMMETTRTALTADRPYLTDPSTTPYGVMNGAAGQCAIWHGFRGPNGTIASGRPTGLTALAYARRLLLTGRARTILCGAAEEYSYARSWLEHHAGGENTARIVLGEGCVMFELTRSPAGRPALAKVLAVESGICTDGDWSGAVDRVARRVIGSGRGADVWASSASGAPGRPGEDEAAALAALVPQAVRVPALTELLGETHAVSAAYQLAAVLALAGRDGDAAGRTAVITSIDPEIGTVTAALVGLGGSR